ncbi:hypothetical protein DPMN_107002 [Dreissena polymorpha]|uniref:Uncharacterized protein n=1 Tax=Dreissena polymorpha TaxID=45954 RepID=A0A9D4K5Y5_DREPO|nr:hypothetical protein DPMN_107002 [Dreissena polymorpha]
MVSVTYKIASTLVTISSQLIGRNSFQLCSSSKAAAIWKDFITAIDYQASKSSGDSWCSASLRASSSSSSDASVNVDHEYTYQNSFIDRTLLNYSCLPPQRIPMEDQSFRSLSLPDMVCGPTDAKHSPCRQKVNVNTSIHNKCVYFRYTMDAHTLHNILRSKYDINEKLQAEGIFVALQGGTMKANGLFSIEIGERFVVVAGINPRGPDIDYNPMSLTPVGMLSVTYKNVSTIVTISSQLKGKNSFQLCSSSKAAAIWNDFTTAIDYLASKSSGDSWCSASLRASSSSFDASVNVDHEYTYQKSFIGRTLLNYSCLPPQRFPMAEGSFSSISLPDMVCGPTDAKHAACRQHVERGHSLDCVDVSFDSFINDYDTNRNAAIQQVDFIAPDTVIGKNCGQLTDERLTDMSSKQPSLLERFLRLFTCCISKR